MSLSARREWIEINFTVIIKSILYVSLTGDRIEIVDMLRLYRNIWSPSVQMEWIEIRICITVWNSLSVSLCLKGEWIEIIYIQSVRVYRGSPFTRREWIEISTRTQEWVNQFVSLHSERADWNYKWDAMYLNDILVSLHSERVDWNNICKIGSKICPVSLHSERVDWNGFTMRRYYDEETSPLLRWRGLKSGCLWSSPYHVSLPLLVGGVDWNTISSWNVVDCRCLPSNVGEWI